MRGAAVRKASLLRDSLESRRGTLFPGPFASQAGHRLVEASVGPQHAVQRGQVQHQLVARQQEIAVGLPDDPVRVLLVKNALRVDHLWLEPDAEAQPALAGLAGQEGEAMGELAGVDLPVAEKTLSLMQSSGDYTEIFIECDGKRLSSWGSS